MKSIMLAICIAAPFIAGAQNDTAKIPIQMKDGKVFYEKVYSVINNTGKEELFSRAVQWLQTSFPDYKESIKADKNAGTVTGTGMFKIAVSASGNYYWLKPVINIKVNDGFYSFQAYSYYEKPIEKGITNDWSKIEYRWWDFRRGHPWSAEDYPLFKGLDDNTLSAMASLEKAMKK